MTDSFASRLILRPPTLADEAAVRALNEVFVSEDFEFSFIHEGESWADYVARVEREAEGRDLPEGRVRAAFLLAEVDGQIVGRTSIRFALNDFLRQYAGHVGYGVAPEFRRRGVATEILRRSLALLAEAGVDRALVTCTETNLGSRGVIEACGGVLENTVEDPDGRQMRRYWIG